MLRRRRFVSLSPHRQYGDAEQDWCYIHLGHRRVTNVWSRCVEEIRR